MHLKALKEEVLKIKRKKRENFLSLLSLFSCAIIGSEIMINLKHERAKIKTRNKAQNVIVNEIDAINSLDIL